MTVPVNMAEDSSPMWRALLGGLGGVLSRHKFGNILMSAGRAGLLGARDGVESPEDLGGGYLEAFLNAPRGWGYTKAQPGGDPPEGVFSPELSEAAGGLGGLGYLARPGGALLGALGTGTDPIDPVDLFGYAPPIGAHDPGPGAYITGEDIFGGPRRKQKR